MQVRMKDIADQLGVSVVTVSKVLRNHTDIGPATRRRVLRKVKELNYQPNWAARSLVTRRSYTIGMILPHLRHTYYQEAYHSIADKTAPHGYTVLIAISGEDPAAEEKEVRQMVARQVDGLILASVRQPHDVALLQELKQRKVPYVLIDRKFHGVEANFVGVDDRAMGAMATEHLIQNGCTRIAHLRGPEVSTALLRFKGYHDALKRHGLPARASYVAGSRGDDQTGYEAMKKLLKLQPRPDGVFCYSDPLAAGAMKAVLEAGLSVPSDVALLGCGNMHYSDLFQVPLSTIDQNSSEMGSKAAEILLSLIDAKRPRGPRTILLSPTIVSRQSSKHRLAERSA
jgi:LacI family transcriptional regulator